MHYFRFLIVLFFLSLASVALAVTEEPWHTLPTPDVAQKPADEKQLQVLDPISRITQSANKQIDAAAQKITPITGFKPIDSALMKVSTLAAEMAKQSAALALQKREAPDVGAMLKDAENKLIDEGINASAEALRATGLPFARNFELEQRIRRGDKPQFSARTIDSLYESKDLRHTTFAEAGLARNGDDRTTLNLGVGYRYINKDETWMYGINSFYDRQWPYDHERLSLGLEATNAEFDLFANRYVPLTNWVNTRRGYEESALGGWDVGISGRVPNIKQLEAKGTAFSWEGREGQKGSDGLKLGLEYTPFPLMTLGFSTAHDTDGKSTTEARIRYNFNTDKVRAEQSRKDLRDLRLHRVNRENEILVFERQASVLTGNVTETVGANTVGAGGSSVALSVGRKITYGETITTENNVAAYAQLLFGDGATLRIGTNSQVRIDLGVITLITGVIQYVSGSTNVTINTPGGTITLLGTDIDVVSNGTTSTVGIRDGAIIAGGINGAEGHVVSLTGGNGALFGPNTTQSLTHRNTVYTRLDSVDPTPVVVPKAAPYVFEAPTVLQSPVQVGDVLRIALHFSAPVVVTGTVNLDIQINSVTRTATYVSGSGTDTLLFNYTTQGADAGQTQFNTVQFQLGGGSITGAGGLGSVNFLPQSTVNLSGPIQAVNPSVVVSTAAGSPTSTSPIPFTLTFSAAVTGLLAGELTVTNGTASGLNTANNIVYTVNITPTVQGPVTVQVPAGAAQSSVGGFNNLISNTVNIVYDTGAPAGYSVNFTNDPFNASNLSATFQLASGEVGTTYNYTISSSGGGANVTGTGTVASATEIFTTPSLAGLNDGTLTLSFTLTDALSNVGATVTDTALKDVVAPTITSVTPPANGTYDDL